MSTHEVLTKIELAWNAWIQVIADVDPDVGSTEEITGGYSLKDLFAHIAMWDREAVKEARARVSGAEGRAIDFNALNAQGFAANADSKFETLHAEMMDAHQTMVEELSHCGSLEESWVENDTWMHYADHTNEVREWQQRSRESESNA